MTSCRELDNSRSALSAASAFAIATAGANEGAPSKDKYRRMSLASAGAWGRLWGQQWPPRPRELSPFACARLSAPGPWLVPTLLAPGSDGPGSAHLAPPPGRLGPSKADARGNPPPHPHGTGPVAEVEAEVGVCPVSTETAWAPVSLATNLGGLFGVFLALPPRRLPTSHGAARLSHTWLLNPDESQAVRLVLTSPLTLRHACHQGFPLTSGTETRSL